MTWLPDKSQVEEEKEEEVVFATWNPSDSYESFTLSNGNLTATKNTADWSAARATIFHSTGKHYYETRLLDFGVRHTLYIGVGDTAQTIAPFSFIGATPDSWCYIGKTTRKRNDNAHVTIAGPATTLDDVLMQAFDLDAGKWWVGMNGVWLVGGDPAAGTGALYTNLAGASIAPMINFYEVGLIAIANFGADLTGTPFAYTVPAGFRAGIYTG